jgi:hypothetical protein
MVRFVLVLFVVSHRNGNKKSMFQKIEKHHLARRGDGDPIFVNLNSGEWNEKSESLALRAQRSHLAHQGNLDAEEQQQNEWTKQPAILVMHHERAKGTTTT